MIFFSSVGPCLEDPIAGWTDILCGICAISLPLSMGIMRVAFTSNESYQDYVPVDIAINATLLAAAKRLKE